MRQEKSEGKKRVFKDWYGENSTEVNAKKKKRYASDGDYANQARGRVREKYREDNNILADGSRVVRMNNGLEYVAYKLSYVGDMLGLNNNTLRGYFQRGYLPTNEFDNTKLKLITIDQIPLIEKFLKVIEGTVKVAGAKGLVRAQTYINNHWRDRRESKKIIAKERQERKA